MKVRICGKGKRKIFVLCVDRKFHTYFFPVRLLNCYCHLSDSLTHSFYVSHKKNIQNKSYVAFYDLSELDNVLMEFFLNDAFRLMM